MASCKNNSMMGKTTFFPMRIKKSARDGIPSVTMYSSGPNLLNGLEMLMPMILGIIKRAPTRIENTPERPDMACTVTFHNGVRIMFKMERIDSDR